MFDNIGSKIKTLAKVITWLGIIASIIIGISIIVSGTGDAVTIGAGIGAAIGGSIGFWIGSFLLYGLGQLIENTDTLVEQNEEILAKMLKEMRKSNSNKEQSPKNKVTKTDEAPSQVKIAIAQSNSKYVDLNCPHCDEVLSFNRQDVENGKQVVCPFCNESFSLTKR